MDLDDDGAIQVRGQTIPCEDHKLCLSDGGAMQVEEFQFFCDKSASSPAAMFASIDADGDGNLTLVGKACGFR